MDLNGLEELLFLWRDQDRKTSGFIKNICYKDQVGIILHVGTKN